MINLVQELNGKDLRSIGNANNIVKHIQSQADFDKVFQLLGSKNRVLAMHAADIMEKITVQHPVYLSKHKTALLQLALTAHHKELLWHIAQVLPRIDLDSNEQQQVNMQLTAWVRDPLLSRIVRVNALQALFEFSVKEVFSKHVLKRLLHELEKENIPSINARIKIIKNKLPECKGGGNCNCCTL